ncbi:hypothetical protein FNV43_RR01238 [Rhamnella rubrinervis]|uniref:Uncharacterized protein n=1 Tax=Rhamnella rubrinervis TaxID=2594499 RepID=A0A8K0HS73_9ROSA|nr:hypothetical protein FNV43_RR01238 [Rhamnella rubrinervis]
MNDIVGEAISLVNKIIANDVAVDDFLGLMALHGKGLMNKKQTYSKISALFHDPPNILEYLQRLAPVEEEGEQVQKTVEQRKSLCKGQRVCPVFAADLFRKRVRDERKGDDDDEQGTTDFRSGTCFGEGIKVFNKVREKQGNVGEYLRFLKLVHMYSKGKINGGDLESMVAELLQMDNDLINEFVEFKRLCESDSVGEIG